MEDPQKKNTNQIRSWQLKIPPFIIRFISRKKQFTHPLGSYGFVVVFPWFFSHPILGPTTVPPWSPPESWRPTVARRVEQRRSRSFRCGARGGDGTPEYSPQTGKGKKQWNSRLFLDNLDCESPMATMYHPMILLHVTFVVPYFYCVLFSPF